MLESINNESGSVGFMLKQNRLIMILLMPLMVVIWTIGWGLYCAGLGRFLANSTQSPRKTVELDCACT